ARMGLDYERLSALNPRLVYLAISGFGASGPDARHLAFDSIVQSMSGAATMSGFGDAPALSHIPYVDFGTGLYGALGVVSALLHRERSGRGQKVDLALFNTGVSFAAAYGVFAEYAINGIIRRAVGNNMIYGVGGIYRCADGELTICCFGDALFERLCRAIGRPELRDDPRLKSDVTRYENREVVNRAISDWLSEKTVTESREKLAEAGVPAGPVETADRVLDNPQAAANRIVRNVEQPGVGMVPVAGSALQFESGASEIERPAPAIGEHNGHFYDSLLGPGTALRLAKDGAI
ncbi:MAG: CaiB/BaiF CoA transferase family protein, partial [Candidatus Binataceae bacterium]